MSHALQLIAQGPEPRQRWRVNLSSGQVYGLGRSIEADLPVPWDNSISRVHAEVQMERDGLSLKRVRAASNPIFVAGNPVTEHQLEGGESFVIGSTKFTVVLAGTSLPSADWAPVEEVAFTRQQLEQVRYDDPDRRIEVLSHLPEIIWGAASERDRNARLISLILAGVRQADAAAIVSLDSHQTLHLKCWERRREIAGVFRPSRRLIIEALNKRQTVLHMWETDATIDYTISGEFDWAYCTPVGAQHAPTHGLYITGRMPPHGPRDPRTGGPRLQADVKFTELLAEILDSIERQGRLEGNLSVLRQFLSPPIVSALERAGEGNVLNTDLLEPRECDVTVLFCDLRGFSQRAEEAGADLQGLLGRVSGALEVMTQNILRHGGVTGDFLGDAVLGFWGWPFGSDEAAPNACRAALAIRREFSDIRNTPDHPLKDFTMGIGVAHGRAVAGKIGTSDRVTVTVFGPVVNLASRLEGLTKQLHVPILLDEATAAIVRERLSTSEGRTRRLARVLPYGMERPLTVSELVPPATEFPDLTDEHLVQYEIGVDHFIAGRWREAYSCLHEMPSSDQAQDFLTLRIAQHNRIAPPGWQGVIEMPNK